MRKAPILILAFAGLITASGCASTQTPKPAVCDGRHRRPANSYGTVLPTVPLPTAAAAPSTPASAPKPATPAAPPASTGPIKPPGPVSALDLKSFDPCGRSA